MDDNSPMRDDFDGKSGSEMLAEVGRLVLLLLGKLLKALGRLLLRGLKYLLKIICKCLLWLIDATVYGMERLRAFWNDNDTQEKLRKMKAATVAAAKQLWMWTVMAATACWQGLVWLAKKTVQGIIHLGPTLRLMGRGLKRAATAVGRWIRSCWRGLCKWQLQRRRAYRRFRQNKGFKGLLVDIGNWLKGQIRDYVEEEPLVQNQLPATVSSEDVMNEDDADDPFVRMENKDSKVHSFGHRLYNAMKRIVED